MKWQAAREQYPDAWLLIEALEAYTTPKKKRIITNLAVLDQFDDFFAAMDAYKQLHRQKPDREMYVIHTENEEIRIKEQIWTGIRGIL
jgi:FMN phosphatase YigB (HAD superfamily)